MPPLWLMHIYALQLPKLEELPPLVQFFFYCGILLAGLAVGIQYAAKKGLRLFAMGISPTDFAKAVAEGNRVHEEMRAEFRRRVDEVDDELKDIRDRSDLRLSAIIEKFNALDKQVSLNAQEILNNKNDIKDLERRKGPR